MAYTTYTTEALVCGTLKRNTSDSSYLLFTKEAGMLYANARSVRVEKSKQRYALQDFSLIRVSLVKGKTGWRIGSVESHKNYYNEAINKTARGSVVSLFRFLRRFIKGEEIMSDVFTETVSYLEFLRGDIVERPFMEEVFQLRLLSKFGYVVDAEIPEKVKSNDYVEISAAWDQNLETTIHKLHTKAVTVSHL